MMCRSNHDAFLRPAPKCGEDSRYHILCGQNCPDTSLGPLKDVAFLYPTDFAKPGSDNGDGAEYLFLAPDHEGTVPEGCFVVPYEESRIGVMTRGIGDVGTCRRTPARITNRPRSAR